jgi:hypothetical protein
VREYRTQGSARGLPGNGQSYLDLQGKMKTPITQKNFSFDVERERRKIFRKFVKVRSEEIREFKFVLRIFKSISIHWWAWSETKKEMNRKGINRDIKNLYCSSKFVSVGILNSQKVEQSLVVTPLAGAHGVPQL